MAALTADPEAINKTGQLLWAADLAGEYGFTDIDGRVPRFQFESAADLITSRSVPERYPTFKFCFAQAID